MLPINEPSLNSASEKVLKESLINGLPLPGSSPIERRATRGFLMPSLCCAKTEPI